MKPKNRPTEKQLNEKGIYTGNPDWANRFNVMRRLAHSINISPNQNHNIQCTCGNNKFLVSKLGTHIYLLCTKCKLEKEL